MANKVPIDVDDTLPDGKDLSAPIIHDPKARDESLGFNRATPITQQQSSPNICNTLMCGALAGIAAKTCIAPIERVKMSFQVSSERFTINGAIQRGITTAQKEGFLSLWKGHSTTVIRVAPYAALSYTFHDLAEAGFKSISHRDKLSAWQKFAAGSIAGFMGTILTYPLDVLRVRIALGGSWQGSISQGGLFQGLLPTLMGIVPYAGTAWWAKQTLLEAFIAHNHHASSVASHDRHTTSSNKPTVVEALAINATAGLVGQFVTYPLDVIRRRMQVAKHPIESFLAVITRLLREEGIRGFAKGFSLNLFKGPLSLSVSLTAYDWLRAHVFNDHDSPLASVYLCYRAPSADSSNSSSGGGGSNGSNKTAAVTRDAS